MAGCKFQLNGASLEALPSGALWWQERALLCVADLHLGKSERIARQGGGLIPPYDTTETLRRLFEAVETLRPELVVCLGDSFDDVEAERGLRREEYIMLATMMAGRHWVWIAGNHDPGPVEIGGTWRAEFRDAPLVFRHIAETGAGAGEVSGHFHPKHRLSAQGRSMSRPCFLLNDTRLILPAFGAYTGGLSSRDIALSSVMGPDYRAILTGQDTLMVPVL